VSKRMFADLSVAALLGVALCLQVGPAAHAQAPPAVTFDLVTVGDPGNACDPVGSGNCFGAVGHTYRIATHEVTNAQYAAFLNAKAALDPLALYNTDMAAAWGGITRSGSSGSYTYSAVPGRENKPVNNVSFFDALRFANWLHNGQGDGSTETGAYTLLGGTPTPSNPMVERNATARFFLPTDPEWYKAASYNTETRVYYDYPAGTDTQIVCSAPTATPNTANCAGAAPGADFTDVGSYTGSPSPSGTFDQGGNVSEWTDMWAGILEQRFIRGGYVGSPATGLRGAVREYDDPWWESSVIGFRVATLEDDGCGDLVCQVQENPLTCPSDCPASCGDGLCTGNENAESCSADCPQVCGDSLCTGCETPVSCLADCGFCGDDICELSESVASCPADCSPVCGNGVLEGTEQCEWGVALGASCTSLGFAGGSLSCNTSTCLFNTSGCFNCKPKFASCTKNSVCCSGSCKLGRCR
jgi:formylglycine-generating enzyme